MMKGFDCSLQERAGNGAGMAALPNRRSRNGARSGASSCGATSLGFGCVRARPLAHPPHPPTKENRPHRGQAEQIGGRAIAFANAGGQAFFKNPWMDPFVTLLPRVALSETHPRTNLEIPVLCQFIHGLCHLFHGSFFWLSAALTPISLSFSNEEREERGGEHRESPIHGFFDCLKNKPRVWSPIHAFSGDQKTGKTQYWRGFAGVLPQIHASTGRNAHTLLETVRND
jgi:hypothetical protein